MTQHCAPPRCASAPPQSYQAFNHALYRVPGDVRFSHAIPGAAALAVGGSEFARCVVERRTKRLEAQAGWLAARVNMLWDQAPPAVTRSS